MANWKEPDPGDEKIYQDWLKTRPKIIQEIGQKFRPWKIYSTDVLSAAGIPQRVIPYSFAEDGTVSALLLAKYNYIPMEHRLFGLKPESLKECDLPLPGEKLGEIYDTDKKKLDYVNIRRKMNGIQPLKKLPGREE